MMKRALALVLCVVMCLSTFAFVACSKQDENYKGEYITMYLSQDMYDFDPANAYNNEATRNVVSLLFDTLFTLDDKGKVRESLADKYEIQEDKEEGTYKMLIWLKDTNWSDNTPITADDVVFAWKRLLDVEYSHEAAALLFDIKNARKVKSGDATIDDVGLYADNDLLTIEFEGKIDYEQFLVNLTSLALAPLREAIVTKSEDWAKKPATMVCSGPFKLARVNYVANPEVEYEDSGFNDFELIMDESGQPSEVPVYDPNTKSFVNQVISNFILERNSYYYRDTEKEHKIDRSVTPYRILVDCSLSDEQIKEAYEQGQILYMGDIPLSLREYYANSEDLSLQDSLSTHTYYFNQNALIQKNGSDEGEALFAIKEVRQALSMAIDRQAVANLVLFANVATGLVPNGVFASGTVKETFRELCNTNYSTLTYNMDAAKELLTTAGINASDYTFAITVAAYDDVHVAIAEVVVKAWKELGFNVDIKLRGTIQNNDYYKDTESIPTDVCDDLYAKDLKTGNFEVIALDSVAFAATPFAVLAPFAKEFSGQAMVMPDGSDDSQDLVYESTPHITGYDSEDYNAIIERVFNEKTIKNRNDALLEAEKLLMEDMPVIPIVFNQYATLQNESLNLKEKNKTTNYYTTTNFKKMEVKEYEEYLDVCEAYVNENFETFKQNPFSYFYKFGSLTLEEFRLESSDYSYLFPVVED